MVEVSTVAGSTEDSTVVGSMADFVGIIFIMEDFSSAVLSSGSDWDSYRVTGGTVIITPIPTMVPAKDGSQPEAIIWKPGKTPTLDPGMKSRCRMDIGK